MEGKEKRHESGIAWGLKVDVAVTDISIQIVREGFRRG